MVAVCLGYLFVFDGVWCFAYEVDKWQGLRVMGLYGVRFAHIYHLLSAVGWSVLTFYTAYISLSCSGFRCIRWVSLIVWYNSLLFVVGRYVYALIL